MTVIDYLYIFVGSVVGAVTLLVIAFFNIEKLIRFIKRFSCYLSWHFGNQKKEKAVIARDLELSINLLLNKYDLPNSYFGNTYVKINTIANGSLKDMYDKIEGNKLVVRFPANVKENDFCANFAYRYIREFILQRERPYINKKLENALDIILAKQVLEYANNAKAISALYNASRIEENIWLNRLHEMIGDVAFFYLLLSEIVFAVDKYNFIPPTKKQKDEISKVCKNIYDYRKEKPNKPEIMISKGSYITIIIFSQPGKLKRVGISNYTYFMDKAIKMGHERFYLIVGGTEGLNVAKNMANVYNDSNQAKLEFEKKFLPHDKYIGYIACLSPKVKKTEYSKSDAQKILIEEAINGIVHEIQQNKLRIFTIILDNINNGAIVSFEILDCKYDLGYVFGAQYSRFNLIKETTGLNNLRIIEYNSDDYLQSVIYALFADRDPDLTDSIENVEYDENENKFNVSVNNASKIGILIGAKGKNIKTAEKLLKASININRV